MISLYQYPESECKDFTIMEFHLEFFQCVFSDFYLLFTENQAANIGKRPKRSAGYERKKSVRRERSGRAPPLRSRKKLRRMNPIR